MKIPLIKLIVIVSTLNFNILTACADEMIQYELSQDKIESVWVSAIEGGIYKGLYEVTVKLNEPNREVFSKLTGDNIGRKLEIVFQGHIFTSAVIKERIESGTMSLGKWNSEEEAKKIIEMIKLNHVKENMDSDH